EKTLVHLLENVGLASHHLDRYPHELSGGQRQRIGIARALSLSPEYIICDEIISALDSSTQTQILELLISLQKTKPISFLFISHNLNAVEKIADTTLVMYLGKIVERGPTAS